MKKLDTSPSCSMNIESVMNQEGQIHKSDVYMSGERKSASPDRKSLDVLLAGNSVNMWKMLVWSNENKSEFLVLTRSLQAASGSLDLPQRLLKPLTFISKC